MDTLRRAFVALFLPIVVAVVVAVVVAAGLTAAGAPASATPGVDLSLDLTDNGARFVVGQDGTYQVKVRNAGTAGATGTTRVDLTWAYESQQLSSASGTGWSCVSDGQTYYETVTCLRTGVVPAGSSAPLLTVTTAVKPGAYPLTSANASLSNSSDHNGTEYDFDQTGVDGPDAALALAGPGSMTVGTDSTVTVTATNAGTVAATGTLTVLVEGHTQFTVRTTSGPGWTCAPMGDDRSCTHAFAVPPGGSVPALSVTIRPDRTAYPAASLDVSITGVDTTTNAATSGDTASLLASVDGIADLSIAGGVAFTDPVLTVGSDATATVDLRNVGTGTNTGPVTVSIELGDGLAYVSRTGAGWSCGDGTGSVECTRTANLAGGARAPRLTVTVAVSVDAYPLASLAASITNATADDPAYGDDGPNNDASALADVDGVADLRLEQNLHSQSVVAGSTVALVLTVSAASTRPVSGATTVAADLPTGISLDSSSGPGWTCAVTAGRLACSRSGSIAAGTSAPALGLTFRFATSLVDTSQSALFTVDNARDVYVSNDAVQHYWFVQHAADLYPFLAGQTPEGAVQPAETVRFTLNAANQGSRTAGGRTTLTYSVPSGLTYLSHQESPDFACTKSGSTLTCTRTTAIPSGSSLVAATVRARVSGAAGSAIDHCVSLTNPNDANAVNNIGCRSYTVT